MGILAYIWGRESEDDAHRDALAGVVKALGVFSFDLPDCPASSFAEETDALAKRIELPDPEVEDVEVDPSKNVVKFVERRRRAEVDYVATTIPGLRDALFDIVRGFSSSLGESEEDDREMSNAIEELASALESENSEIVRSRARSAVSAVQENLRRRQRRNRAQVERMGRQLKEMQARVVEAEARQSQDKLTGLPNRAALDTRIEQEVMVSQLTGDPMSAMMLDVDHFKKFNDTHGHAAGDRVLEEVGNTLVQCFPRKSDFAARYGGEEFCVVLANVGLDRAGRLAERFRKALRDLVVVYEGKELRVTCSVGVAELRSRETAAALLTRADTALYSAKRAGRDRVALEEPA